MNKLHLNPFYYICCYAWENISKYSKSLLFCVISFLGCLSLYAAENSTDVLKFAESFIASYDLSKRETHEYTPHILSKTKESFLGLEKSIKDAGFQTAGHIAILGYQEEALPPYVTHWARNALQDEVPVTTNQGITTPAKNIFGFATGFLLKDGEWFAKKWSADKVPFINHIYARKPLIFNDKAIIFQKHALGKNFDFIIEYRNLIEKAIYTKDLKKILKILYDFWIFMYTQAAQTGSQELMASQDMLFSIEYARALLTSLLSVNKLWVGPDITYPIEVLTCQKQEVTAHAQKFITEFQKELKPLYNQKTAYIFCSFVDGVGKSTLLNNIYNWSRYKNDFNCYKRCDNSSSQEATVFKFDEQVVIVDLPAQVSHYAFKPDGYVYVDVQTVKGITSEEIEEILDYRNSHEEIIAGHFEMIYKSVVENKPELYQFDNPEYCYIHNLLIFNTLENLNWFPFRYKDQHYLYNIQDPNKLRILVSLSEAHSFGLKAVEPEQMLFLKGLSVPMSYQIFLDDLIEKLKKSDVKQVCFVDFLSMYPRSSRENIRLNFVLQYLKKIFGKKYNINKSFYKHKLYQEQEVCSLLVNNFKDAVHTLYYETLMRMALYKILYSSLGSSVSTESAKNIEDLIASNVLELQAQYGKRVKALIKERLAVEQITYKKQYDLDPLYQSLVQFSGKSLVALSDTVTKLFSNAINNNYVKSIWSGFSSNFNMMHAALLGAPALESGTAVNILYDFNKKTSSENDLKEPVRFLRAQWYKLFSQLLDAQKNEQEYNINSIQDFVAPLGVKLHEDTVFVVQKKLSSFTADITFTPLDINKLIKYNINPFDKKQSYGVFNDKPHCLSGVPEDTYTGVYAYSYMPDTYDCNTVTLAVDHYLEKRAHKNKSRGISTSKLYNLLINSEYNEFLKKEIARELAGSKMRIIKLDDPARSGIQLWAQLIATLELLAKDPHSVILLRKNNKEDFIAAIRLLEQVTLPVYYNIQLEGPLFDDYNSLNPLI